jgi:hypothetical protein
MAFALRSTKLHGSHWGGAWFEIGHAPFSTYRLSDWLFIEGRQVAKRRMIMCPAAGHAQIRTRIIDACCEPMQSVRAVVSTWMPRQRLSV